jgi:hypothetical protein
MIKTPQYLTVIILHSFELLVFGINKFLITKFIYIRATDCINVLVLVWLNFLSSILCFFTDFRFTILQKWKILHLGISIYYFNYSDIHSPIFRNSL